MLKERPLSEDAIVSKLQSRAAESKTPANTHNVHEGEDAQ
jgi:hypothetical protein